jgi:hypothetical protein
MPRPRRLDFKGAIHLVRIAGRKELKIFFDLDDRAKVMQQPSRAAVGVRRLQKIITAVCEECGAVLYAYCIESNACTLLVEIGGSPLVALMSRVCGQYSRYLHRDGLMAKAVHPYAGRYKSKIIAPRYLPHAVRRVHAGEKSGPAFTSAPAYTGGRVAIPLGVDAVRGALAQRGFAGAIGYRAFMQEPESGFVTQLFERGSPGDARIVGDRSFVIRAHSAASHQPILPSRQQLIETVASIIDRKPEDLFSPTHAGALGRALVAWYAVRSGAATLTETGKWFSVSAASLGHGIRHHRQVEPGLFKRKWSTENDV